MKHVEKSHRLRGECGLKGDYDLDQFSVIQTIKKNIKAESFYDEKHSPPQSGSLGLQHQYTIYA